MRGSGPSIGIAARGVWDAGLGGAHARPCSALPQHEQLSHMALPLEHSPEPTPMSYSEPEPQVQRVRMAGDVTVKRECGARELARAGLVREVGLWSRPLGHQVLLGLGSLGCVGYLRFFCCSSNLREGKSQFFFFSKISPSFHMGS